MIVVHAAQAGVLESSSGAPVEGRRGGSRDRCAAPADA